MFLLDETDALRSKAHEIWIDEGQPEGRALDHWLAAQRELDRQRSLDLSQPWYRGAWDEPATEWMRRMLWEPQPFDLRRFS